MLCARSLEQGAYCKRCIRMNEVNTKVKKALWGGVEVNIHKPRSNPEGEVICTQRRSRVVGFHDSEQNVDSGSPV